MEYKLAAMQCLTTKDVAELLAVSTRTVTRWCQRGDIKCVWKTDGDEGQWRIPVDSLESFLQERSA